MGKKSASFINLVYAVLSFGYYMIQNGIVVIPGTLENDGIVKNFTKEFLSVFRIIGVVLALIGIGIVIYDYLAQKKLQKTGRIGCLIALCVDCFTAFALLAMSMVPITCLLGVVASVIMLLPEKNQ